MQVTVQNAGIRGSVAAPCSKSFVHRALLCSALADAPVSIRFGQSCADIDATIQCIRALGGTVTQQAADLYEILPITQPAADAVLNCGESGSTLRFILPVAAAVGAAATVTGQGRLPERPIGPLTEQLVKNGCRIEGERLPVKLSGQLHGGTYRIPGNVSSQFLSGLLMALPRLEENSRVVCTTALHSAGYVQMTLAVMRMFGVQPVLTQDGYEIRAQEHYHSPGCVDAEGDWSAAAALFCAAAVHGSVTVHGLQLQSEQPDKQILQLLSRMGAQVQVLSEGITVQHDRLHAIDMDASEVPDLVPAFAAVASVAQGTTRIYHAERLRHKESDRLACTADTLQRLGADMDVLPDGLLIRGQERLQGGETCSHQDHRLAMAAAVAAGACQTAVHIAQAEAVGKSYPAFWRHMAELGGM